jgi:hypothetical protein
MMMMAWLKVMSLLKWWRIYLHNVEKSKVKARTCTLHIHGVTMHMLSTLNTPMFLFVHWRDQSLHQTRIYHGRDMLAHTPSIDPFVLWVRHASVPDTVKQPHNRSYVIVYRPHIDQKEKYVSFWNTCIGPRMWPLFSILWSSTGTQIFVVNERNSTNFVSYWSLLL